jgi:outer membrane protein OmpA-like peptidoglycan-associated protein
MTQGRNNISYALLAVALAASLLYQPVIAAGPEAAQASSAQPRVKALSAPLQQDFDALISEIEARQPAEDAPAETGASVTGTVEEQLNAARIQIGILQQAVISALGARAEAEVQLEKLWRDSQAEIEALERDLARAKGGSDDPAGAQVGRAAHAAALPAADDPEPGDASAAASAARATGPAEVMLSEIHFNPGSAALTPGGERKALETAAKIKSLGASNVRVSGYTDTQGPAAYNMHLSLRRARSIADLLESVGVSTDIIAVEGHGEEGGPEPTADQVSEPLNRCAGIFAMVDLP